MPADWTIKSGDTEPAYQNNIAYSDGTVPNLHGATVTLRLRSLANASLKTLLGQVAITDPNSGIVTFVPSSLDTTTPGHYLAEWVVNFAPDTLLGTQTFPTDGYDWVFIEPNLGVLPQQVVDLPTVKRYLNIQGQDHTRDVELMGLIDDVTPLVEAEVGPLLPTNYEEWCDGGSNVISLSHDPSYGFGSNPLLQMIAASEYRGPIEYPLALVASPAFGSIYSVMLVPGYAAITRRSAGGRTLAFMPGRDSVHVFYQAGQSPTPGPVKHAILEYVRMAYRWPQQIGTGSLSPADRMEMGAALQSELARIVRMWTRPMRRYPSIA